MEWQHMEAAGTNHSQPLLSISRKGMTEWLLSIKEKDNVSRLWKWLKFTCKGYGNAVKVYCRRTYHKEFSVKGQGIVA